MAGGKYYPRTSTTVVTQTGKSMFKGHNARNAIVVKPVKSKPTVKNVSKRVRKLENQRETRYIDTVVTADPNISVNSVYCLNLISEGNDFNNRAADQLTATNLYLRMNMGHPASAQFDEARIIVVWDKDNHGQAAFPLLTSVGGLENSFLDDSTMNSFNAMYNYRTNHRFVPLYDVIHQIEPQSSATLQTKPIVKHINLHQATVKYGDNAANLTSISSRGLFICVLYRAAAFSAGSLFNINARFMWKDP